MDAPTSSDPLADARPALLRRLARRADRLRRRRPDALPALAAQHGVTVRRLRLLADAWAEAGASGVQALGPALPMPVEPMAHADAELARWWAAHHPLESLRWDVWRNRITVWWLVPDADRRDVERRPLLHLRLTHDGRWHLYRRAAQGEWWPVVVRGPRHPQTLQHCLEAVELDAGNGFWSAPAPTLASLDEQPDPLD
jgi:hypothetical protein